MQSGFKTNLMIAHVSACGHKTIIACAHLSLLPFVIASPLALFALFDPLDSLVQVLGYPYPLGFNSCDGAGAVE
jgi:hypothetical protein